MPQIILISYMHYEGKSNQLFKSHSLQACLHIYLPTWMAYIYGKMSLKYTIHGCKKGMSTPGPLLDTLRLFLEGRVQRSWVWEAVLFPRRRTQTGDVFIATCRAHNHNMNEQVVLGVSDVCQLLTFEVDLYIYIYDTYDNEIMYCTYTFLQNKRWRR